MCPSQPWWVLHPPQQPPGLPGPLKSVNPFCPSPLRAWGLLSVLPAAWMGSSWNLLLTPDLWNGARALPSSCTLPLLCPLVLLLGPSLQGPSSKKPSWWHPLGDRAPLQGPYSLQGASLGRECPGLSQEPRSQGTPSLPAGGHHLDPLSFAPRPCRSSTGIVAAHRVQEPQGGRRPGRPRSHSYAGGQTHTPKWVAGPCGR